MRHKVAGRKLGRTSGHRRALYRNLVTDLLGYGKITTTEPKAKEVRGLADRMITLGKKGGLSARRRALGYILDGKTVDRLFSDLSTKYASRSGGYTRIVKLGPRQGDGAPMVRIELVD